MTPKWYQREQPDDDPSKGELGFSTDQNEPLARFLVGTLRLTPVAVVIMTFGLVALIHGLTLLIFVLFNRDRLGDFIAYQFGQWAVVAVFWVAVPALMGFYPWIIRASGSLYEELRQAGVLKTGSQTLRMVIKTGDRSVEKVTCHPAWTYAAIIVTVLVNTVIMIQGYQTVWPATPEIGRDIWVLYAVALPANLVVWYALTIIIGRYIATILGLSVTFGREVLASKDHPIVLRPWHPDGAGGLGDISNYALRVSWFIAIAGLSFLLFTYISFESRSLGGGESGWSGLATALTTDSVLLAGIVVYVVLSPTVFFLTLGAAHGAMADAKRNQLGLLSDRLDIEYEHVHKKLALPGVRSAASMGNIRRLTEMYHLTQSFPVWPFDIGTIRRFGAAVIAPFVSIGAPFGLAQLLVAIGI